MPSFQIIQERSCAGAALFEKTIFSESLKKILYFRVFFWERSSVIFRLTYKIIFSGKRNIIFPDNTRKIIFQRNFFGKTIFSERLEKENIIFCAVKIEPQTLLKINPQMLLKINPQMLLEIDPQTLLKIDPQTVLKINPQTLLKSDPRVLLKLNPQTLLKINPQTLLYIDPQTLLKLDPET